MLELYGDMIDRTYPDADNWANQEDPQSNHRTVNEPLKEDEPQNEPLKEERPLNEPKNEPQNGPKKEDEPLSGPKNGPQKEERPLNEPLNGPQKMLETIRQNPQITKTALSGILGVSASTLKRWLRSNDVVWVGSSKNGHWEITLSE